MTARPWAPGPKAGDIVQSRFPEGKAGSPGPKDRPALVIEVEADTANDAASIAKVAYGTSQDVEQRHPGEFTVRATDPKAGLDRDTKFDLGNTVRLPFDTDWFAPSPNRRFGDHPKRGTLTLKDPKKPAGSDGSGGHWERSLLARLVRFQVAPCHQRLTRSTAPGPYNRFRVRAHGE